MKTSLSYSKKSLSRQKTNNNCYTSSYRAKMLTRLYFRRQCQPNWQSSVLCATSIHPKNRLFCQTAASLSPQLIWTRQQIWALLWWFEGDARSLDIQWQAIGVIPIQWDLLKHISHLLIKNNWTRLYSVRFRWCLKTEKRKQRSSNRL